MIPTQDAGPALQWLIECRLGEQASCERLAAAVHERIRLFVSHKIYRRPVADQEDVVQEVMREFWERRDGILENPYLFALKIARYKLLEYYARVKKGQRNDPLETGQDDPARPLPDPTQNVDEWLLGKERVRKILEVIAHMNPFCGRVVKGLLAGFTVAEILEDELRRDAKLTRSNFDVKKLRCIEGLQQALPQML